MPACGAPICAAPRLRGANLIGADLFEADLREGTIAEKDKIRKSARAAARCGSVRTAGGHAEFRQSRARQDTGAIAVQADFTDAVMKGCRLIRANLRQARLTGANLENADLSGCNLTGADLAGAILIGAKWTSPPPMAPT